MKSYGTWLARAALALLSVALVLLAAEAALRVMYARDRARGGTLQQQLLRAAQATCEPGRNTTDLGKLVRASGFEDVVYELKPELDCLFYHQRVVTSSAGLRDREYPAQKPAGVFRIVGLGDSIMFGWGVDEKDCYLSRLEDALNALPQPHPRYEVLNFAVPGYNTWLEVATLERKALAYEPDLVIKHFVNNDLGVPAFMMRPPEQPSWKKSCLLEFLRVRAGWLKQSYADEGLVEYRFRDVSSEDRANVMARYRHMAGFEGYLAAAERLAALTKPRNLPVLIVSGSLYQGQAELLDHVHQRYGFGLLKIGPYTDRALQARGIGTRPEEWQKALWVSPNDHHPNAFGHEIYMDGVLDKLREMDLLPRSGNPT